MYSWERVLEKHFGFGEPEGWVSWVGLPSWSRQGCRRTGFPNRAVMELKPGLLLI